MTVFSSLHVIALVALLFKLHSAVMFSEPVNFDDLLDPLLPESGPRARLACIDNQVPVPLARVAFALLVKQRVLLRPFPLARVTLR